MDIIWIIGGFCFFILIVFLVITFLFPEVMGITGQAAKSIIEHQKESTIPKADQDSPPGAP